MYTKIIHSFDLDLEQMSEIQKSLRKKITTASLTTPIHYVCGVDTAYFADQAITVMIVMDYHKKQILETVWHQDSVTCEYVPGFLAFRELPLFLNAWKKRTIDPDLVFFDGNGILHPQRVGIATHASFFIEKPTIGIAKNYFIGTYEPPGKEQGSFSYIYDHDEIIGAALRTQTNVKPVYISIGNGLSLENAIQLSMHFVSTQSRIPEITRQADILTRKLRKRLQK